MAVDPARYWQREKPDDLALLPTRMQGWAELDRVAAQVEADVILTFTRDITDLRRGLQHWGPPFAEYTQVGEQRGVFLRHYQEDASTVVEVSETAAVQADQSAFLAAMKRTIAAVIEWRFLSEQKDPQLDQVSDGTGKHQTKNVHHHEPFPPSWQRFLRPWVTLVPDGAGGF